MTVCVSSLRSALLVNGRKESFNVVSKSMSNAAPAGGAISRDSNDTRTLLKDPAHLKRKNELETQQLEREQNAAKDLDAVGRALAGDMSGFQELVQRYEKRVYNVALAVLGNTEDAKDVTQDAFIRVYQRLEGFRGESSFYTWLYRITFNLAVDLSRKRYRTRELGFAEGDSNSRTATAHGSSGIRLEGVSESSFSATVEHPDEAYERGELNRQLNNALESLTEEHRAVISMRELDGLSYSEIAEAVGISKGTVMSRLHHARRKLQQYLLKTV
jgi:RNA polymerase sigma-70 factor (ECF subfamily)